MLKAKFIALMCVMIILFAVISAAEDDSNSFWSSLWSGTKKWSGAVWESTKRWSVDGYEWAKKNVEVKDVFAVGGWASKAFDIQNTGPFKFLSGNKRRGAGLGIGGFEFRFLGWEGEGKWLAGPEIGYRDSATKTNLGWKSTNGIFALNREQGWIFDQSKGFITTAIPGIAAAGFNLQNGFDAYARPQGAPGAVRYFKGKNGLGWYDLKGEKVGEFNFGYEPLPNLVSDFGKKGDKRKNTEDVKKLGAQMQWNKWAIGSAELSLHDKKITKMVDSILDSQINEMRTTYGFKIRDTDIDDKAVQSIKNKTLKNVHKAKQYLMSFSVENRPILSKRDISDVSLINTCTGRCMEECGDYNTAMGSCPGDVLMCCEKFENGKKIVETKNQFNKDCQGACLFPDECPFGVTTGSCATDALVCCDIQNIG